MTEWFRDAFGAHYLSLYAHRDEEEAAAMVDLIMRTVQPPPAARVLDAPCGAGRHTRQFARRGLRPAGIDLSRDLLDAATEAQIAAGTDAQYVRADLRTLPFPAGQFTVVANLFSSFGYFIDEWENLQVVRELIRVCVPGGHVVLDYMNEPFVRASLEPLTERTTPDGWQVTERRMIGGQPPRVEKIITVRSDTGESRCVRESVRLYTRQELRNLLRDAGLTILYEFGDYGGGPWLTDSERLILIGCKR
ncbi:MAG: class I SAM-dependent methyltransferase [Candidatus Sumerlaeaceae bacterium]|nr:class I SAM-dependent methyltransferase [Candidatus Sumerlaeaceae bacterium]